MTTNCLNPNFALSRLLERLGLKDYNERVAFGAHFFLGLSFALGCAHLVRGDSALWMLILGHVVMGLYVVWVFVDEFIFDGFKGRDTYYDLASKLAGPVGYLAWILLR